MSSQYQSVLTISPTLISLLKRTNIKAMWRGFIDQSISQQVPICPSNNKTAIFTLSWYSRSSSTYTTAMSSTNHCLVSHLISEILTLSCRMKSVQQGLYLNRTVLVPCHHFVSPSNCISLYLRNADKQLHHWKLTFPTRETTTINKEFASLNTLFTDMWNVEWMFFWKQDSSHIPFSPLALSYLQLLWHAPGSGSAAEAPPPAPAARRWSRCWDGRTRTVGSRIGWRPSWRGAAGSSSLYLDPNRFPKKLDSCGTLQLIGRGVRS